MKNVDLVVLFFLVLNAAAQEGMRSLGMLKIHNNGGMGFHANLINDGTLDDNQGLVGFYSDHYVTISGAFAPIFHDMEVIVAHGLYLDVAMGVENHINFVLGDVTTSKTGPFNALDFLQDSFYTGATHISKVDGYVTLSGQRNFIFPVGDDEKLRPLVLNSEAINPMVSCAYFYENPNSPNTFIGSFNTNSKEARLSNISLREFWHLDGSILSSVRISWDERSAMDLLTDNVDDIVIVGWNKSSKQWESLGGSAIGELAQGLAISGNFMPNEYEVLTFGITKSPKDIMDLPNYLVTPNGDGINDFLKIPELEMSPNNHLRIYNRNGLLVFDQANYTNGFNGYATEGDIVINRKNGLPSGVYFYLVRLDDLGMEYQGFLYLKND